MSADLTKYTNVADLFSKQQLLNKYVESKSNNLNITTSKGINCPIPNKIDLSSKLLDSYAPTLLSNINLKNNVGNMVKTSSNADMSVSIFQIMLDIGPITSSITKAMKVMQDEQLQSLTLKDDLYKIIQNYFDALGKTQEDSYNAELNARKEAEHRSAIAGLISGILSAFVGVVLCATGNPVLGGFLFINGIVQASAAGAVENGNSTNAFATDCAASGVFAAFGSSAKDVETIAMIVVAVATLGESLASSAQMFAEDSVVAVELVKLANSLIMTLGMVKQLFSSLGVDFWNNEYADALSFGPLGVATHALFQLSSIRNTLGESWSQALEMTLNVVTNIFIMKQGKDMKQLLLTMPKKFQAVVTNLVAMIFVGTLNNDVNNLIKDYEALEVTQASASETFMKTENQLINGVLNKQVDQNSEMSDALGKSMSSLIKSFNNYLEGVMQMITVQSEMTNNLANI